MESDSVSDDDQDTASDSVTAPTEADGEVQIITEIWIEPQVGRVVAGKHCQTDFLSGLHQKEQLSLLLNYCWPTKLLILPKSSFAPYKRYSALFLVHFIKQINKIQ